MYNHNNNGKYLIHYGRKGMKWGQHIFTQDDTLSGLFRRKRRSKKVDDRTRSRKQEYGPDDQPLTRKQMMEKEALEAQRSRKKIDDLVRSGKYRFIHTKMKHSGDMLQSYDTITNSKGKTIRRINTILSANRMSDKEIDDAIRILNDPRGTERRVSGLISGLRESHNRNDLGDNIGTISQDYKIYDTGPAMGISVSNIDDAGHSGHGTYYVNTDEFDKNDFAIDG